MNAPRVLLLHGLWMHAPSMQWLAARLRRQGFAAEVHGYYSLLEDTDRAVERIATVLQREPGTHLLAHSMGGLLGLRAVSLLGAQTRGRVVCLGTPLAGSRAANGLIERMPVGRAMIGRHLPLLLEGAGPLPTGLDVGVIAGSKPLGLGRMIAGFDDIPHDGTVAVDETRIDGLRDHLVAPVSHGGMMFSELAVEQSAHFFRHGSFRHATRQAA